MTKLSILLMAGSLLAAAAPAISQAHDMDQGYVVGAYGGGDWNNGGATYAQFNEEYQHIAQMIRHGASDGTLNRNQVAGSFNELRYIRRLAYAQQQRGYYNPGNIQARLTRLHDGLHLRHEAGHAAQQREGYGADGYRGGYDNQGYNSGYRNEQDDHHDHQDDPH